MRIFVMILMFVYVLYITNTLDTSRDRRTAYYFCMAIIAIAYLASCMYVICKLGW